MSFLFDWIHFHSLYLGIIAVSRSPFLRLYKFLPCASFKILPFQPLVGGENPSPQSQVWSKRFRVKKLLYYFSKNGYLDTSRNFMFLYYFMLFSYSYINYRDFTFKGLCCVLTDRIFSYGEFLLTKPLQEGGVDQSTTTLSELSESHVYNCYAAEGGSYDSREKEKKTDNNQGNGSLHPTGPVRVEGGAEPDNDQSNDSKNEPENNKGKSRNDFDLENGSETLRLGDPGESSDTEKSLNPWEGSDAAEDMDDKYYHALKDKQLWGDFNYNSETDQGEADNPVASSSIHKSPESEQEPEYDADVED